MLIFFLENILHVNFFLFQQKKNLFLKFFFTIKYVIFHCLVILKNYLKIIICYLESMKNKY